ncbi:MAG: sodium-dependent transporter [Pseudomonadota bacterium]
MAVATTQWTSRFAFLMAAIGSAVGLGNLWRFPFQTGQNGGAAFVFVYFLCVALVAYPILMAELAVGRHQGLSPVGSIKQLAKDSGSSPKWSIAGWVGTLAALTVLTTYSVIAGQVLAYSVMTFSGEFVGGDPSAGAATLSLYSGSAHAIGWHTLFMVITVFVVSKGLHGGIERVVTILMPIFFVMLAGLCVYALVTGDAGRAISYLFAPDFSKLTPLTVLAAMGQAFFSVGVGAAIMITYGSFLSKDENIGNSAAVIAGADTFVAVIAGLMIFPIIFAFGLDPAAGAGLIFNALPAIFSGMPGGLIIGGLFFFLAFIAALTSSISLLLSSTTIGVEQYGLSRPKAALIPGAIVWVVGVMAITVSGLSDWLDFFSGSVMITLGGFLIATFVGWAVPRNIMRSELSNTSDGMFSFWHFFCKWLAPAAVAITLLLGVDAKFDFGLAALLGG